VSENVRKLYENVQKVIGNVRKCSKIFQLYAHLIDFSISHKKAQKTQRKLDADYAEGF
jgi:predicted patatin/cPLA2 family phospholipase